MAKFISYAEKLKDPRWQRKRLEILQRENFTCENCGDTESTLHVHNGYYEKGLEPWEYFHRTLHCLCEECHKYADTLRREVNYKLAKLSLSDLCEMFDMFRLCRNLSEKEMEEAQVFVSDIANRPEIGGDT